MRIRKVDSCGEDTFITIGVNENDKERLNKIVCEVIDLITSYHCTEAECVFIINVLRDGLNKTILDGLNVRNSPSLSEEEIKDIWASEKEFDEGKCKVYDNLDEFLSELDRDE